MRTSRVAPSTGRRLHHEHEQTAGSLFQNARHFLEISSFHDLHFRARRRDSRWVRELGERLPGLMAPRFPFNGIRADRYVSTFEHLQDRHGRIERICQRIALPGKISSPGWPVDAHNDMSSVGGECSGARAALFTSSSIMNASRTIASAAAGGLQHTI